MTQEAFREYCREPEKSSSMTKKDWIDVAERLFRENMDLKNKLKKLKGEQ